MYAVVVTHPVDKASNTTDVARRDNPVPPYFSSQYNPPKPNSAVFFITSTGKCSYIYMINFCI